MTIEYLSTILEDDQYAGTPFKELEQVLPSQSKTQIKVLVRELQHSDLIYVVGKTSAARWFAR